MSTIIAKTNNLFFFIDKLIQGDYDDNFLNVNNFFKNVELLTHVKIFLNFPKNKVDFNLLEKNNKLLFFFYFFNKMFYKDQIKNLKVFFNIEKNFFSVKILKIKFYLNLYFFFQHFILFIFLIKKIALIKIKKN